MRIQETPKLPKVGEYNCLEFGLQTTNPPNTDKIRRFGGLVQVWINYVKRSRYHIQFAGEVFRY
ncbi:hypothetical protein NIES2100_73280 [Calothrix sp. NIES-2100]|nr:hypothetical protein NIES2100_73280 [Calothrix sp. NIES-2100]